MEKIKYFQNEKDISSVHNYDKNGGGTTIYYYTENKIRVNFYFQNIFDIDGEKLVYRYNSYPMTRKSE